MSTLTLFKELVSNAFDFLETAFNEFENKPKYSTIHFCIAIELILKARLMHEHWSLIVDGKPDINKFKDGNFKSINFKELIPRIESVLGEKVPDDTKKCFDAIANHRNKMVHFFHEADDPKHSEEIKQEIAIEQARGWFYLKQLLGKWSDIFTDYAAQIETLNSQLKGHQVYLKTIYKNILPEIENDKKNGGIYRTCMSCSFEASKENKLTENLIESNCRVCNIKEWVFEIKCPECDKPIKVSEHDASTIRNCECGQIIDPEIIEFELNTNPVSHKNYTEYTSVNCANCLELDTVIEHEDYWICTSCFSVTDNMSICSWCNDGQIGGGNLKDSFYSGCEFCDGQAGWKNN